MNISNLISITGTIESLQLISGSCNEFMLHLSTPDGPINIILEPNTYVVDSIQMRAGMRIAAFYNIMAPAPSIFPPQYRAALITALPPDENITLKFFDANLTADDQSLRLHIGPNTDIRTQNGQIYTCNPANNPLLVYYGITTRSIPPQTTPNRIVVF